MTHKSAPRVSQVVVNALPSGVRLDFNAEDVRMIEGRSGARLPLEALQTLLLDRDCLGQYFDRDLAAEACVPRAVDLAHAACPESDGDFIRAEACPRQQWHAGIIVRR
jgi:hypothetical protein